MQRSVTLTKQIPLSEAGLRLGLDYQQCRRLVLTGRLAGGRDGFGRLYVNEASVSKILRDTAGRPTDSSLKGRRRRSA